MDTWLTFHCHFHCHCIPKKQEESYVRENAQKSAEFISAALPSEVFDKEYTAMITRLASKEWFTARMSACTLIANSFTRFNPSEQEIQVQHFANLCRDEVPMVRRVAAQNLGQMVTNVVESKGKHCAGPNGMITTTLIPLYEEMASHNQPDSVRLHTSTNCVAFGSGMSKVQSLKGKDDLSVAAANVLVKRIIPLIVATIDDRSWRVRWTAASKFAEVVRAFEQLDETLDHLIPAYEKLLQDPEAEVSVFSYLSLFKILHIFKIYPSLRTKFRSEQQRHLILLKYRNANMKF